MGNGVLDLSMKLFFSEILISRPHVGRQMWPAGRDSGGLAARVATGGNGRGRMYLVDTLNYTQKFGRFQYVLMSCEMCLLHKSKPSTTR